MLTATGWESAIDKHGEWAILLAMAALRDVECFALVARHRSFSRAAAALGLSQPAVSQAVARLERELGVRLFERTSREVEPTPAGAGLLAHAEALLEQAAAFHAEAARLAVPAPATMRLAYAPLAGGFAARLARRLAGRKPGLDLELVPAGWRAATDELTRARPGAAVAALMSTPFPPGFASAARFHVPLTHLALGAADPLSTAAALTLERAGRLLLPRGVPLPPGPFDLAPDPVDDPAAALDLVAAGRGALPVPQLLVDTVRRPDVRFVPLAGPPPRLTFALVWSAQAAGEDVMALVQAAQDALRR